MLSVIFRSKHFKCWIETEKNIFWYCVLGNPLLL